MSGHDCVPIRILIADDHPMLRDGVCAAIDAHSDMEVVAEAATGDEAVACYERLRPDVTLMDLRMPGGSGLKAIEAIRAAHTDARIIVLTTYSGDVLALQALRAGASGYILKSSLRRELLDAIRSVHAGRQHLNAEIAHGIAVHAVDELLTTRETEVLRLIARGYANKQIAWHLHLAEDTIKSYVKNIFGKLQVNDRTHAVTMAAKRGIIDL